MSVSIISSGCKIHRFCQVSGQRHFAQLWVQGRQLGREFDPPAQAYQPGKDFDPPAQAYQAGNDFDPPALSYQTGKDFDPLPQAFRVSVLS